MLEERYASLQLEDLEAALEDREAWLNLLSDDVLDAMEADPDAGEILQLHPGDDILKGRPFVAMRLCYEADLGEGKARLLCVPPGTNEELDRVMMEVTWLAETIAAAGGGRQTAD